MVATGASNDIQQVADIAKQMVKAWGMSDKVSHIALSKPQSPSFVGQYMLHQLTQWSSKILSVAEEEVEHLVNNAYLVAKKILTDNMDLLEHLMKTLLEQEVFSAKEFQMMLF